jgi:antitoxin HigA-1
MAPVHPGRVLKRELAARELNAVTLAECLRVSASRVRAILAGRSRISAEMALRLARFFGNSPQFWMNLQTRYELAIVSQRSGARIAAEIDTAA